MLTGTVMWARLFGATPLRLVVRIWHREEFRRLVPVAAHPERDHRLHGGLRVLSAVLANALRHRGRRAGGVAPRAAIATQRGLHQCFGPAGGAGTELTLPAGAPPSSSQVATRSASGRSLCSPAGSDAADVGAYLFNVRQDPYESYDQAPGPRATITQQKTWLYNDVMARLARHMATLQKYPPPQKGSSLSVAN